MDRVQKWCEIRHNYILANESKLSYSIHIERYVPIYILFESLISWTQEDKGQELPPRVLDGSKGHKVDKYPFPSCTGRRSRPGLGRGTTGCFPRVFLMLCRSCCVRCDLLCVIDLCNPGGTVSAVLHLSSVLVLPKIQGGTQLVRLASNFSPLQSSTQWVMSWISVENL